RLGGVPLRDVAHSYRPIIAATLAGAAVLLLIVLSSTALLDGRLAYLVAVLVGGPLFFLVYGLIAHRLGVRELAEAAGPLLRRQGRQPASTPADEGTAGDSAPAAAEPSASAPRTAPQAPQEGLAEPPGETEGSGAPAAPGDEDVAASAAYRDLRHAEQ